MKILLDSATNIWFTSDTHYSHKNITYGVSDWDDLSSTRKFDTVDDMNNALISNINKYVKEDDVIFHLGDFAFGSAQNIYEFRKKINCKTIYLIYGNHDKNIQKNLIVYDGDDSKIPVRAKELFAGLYDYLYLTVNFVEDISKRFFLKPNRTQTFALSHYPFSAWEGMEDGSIHLHGHIHSNQETKWGSGKRLDVGVDGNDLKPYNLLNDIILKMDKN